MFFRLATYIWTKGWSGRVAIKWVLTKSIFCIHPAGAQALKRSGVHHKDAWLFINIAQITTISLFIFSFFFSRYVTSPIPENAPKAMMHDPFVKWEATLYFSRLQLRLKGVNRKLGGKASRSARWMSYYWKRRCREAVTSYARRTLDRHFLIIIQS